MQRRPIYANSTLCDDNEQDLNYYSDLIYTLAKKKILQLKLFDLKQNKRYSIFPIMKNQLIFYCWIFICRASMALKRIKTRQAPFHFQYSYSVHLLF